MDKTLEQYNEVVENPSKENNYKPKSNVRKINIDAGFNTYILAIIVGFAILVYYGIIAIIDTGYKHEFSFGIFFQGVIYASIIWSIAAIIAVLREILFTLNKKQNN